MSDEFDLYRGIAVEPSLACDIIANIFNLGILGDEGVWRLPITSLKHELDLYKYRCDLTSKLTRNREDFYGVCACGDIMSAAHYATIHNASAVKTCPVVIHFKASIENIYIDGRDFLYSVFQRYAINKDENLENKKAVLVKIYGKFITEYLNCLTRIGNGKAEQRFCLCDIAIQDDNVIKSHFSNKIPINGRYNTRFSSAFIVRPPILASQIVDIYIADGHPVFSGQFITLDMLENNSVDLNNII